MILERRADWEQRLFQFIQARSGWAFEWGKHDCCLFAADAVIAMTGVDLAEKYRGKYNSASGAKRFGRVEALVVKSGLKKLDNKRFARRGDVVLIAGKRPLLGVCVGAQCVAPGKNQLLHFKMSGASRAWRVG